MGQEEYKKVGLIVGREKDWPAAFIAEMEKRDEPIVAEFVKIGATHMHDVCPYPVIIDRMSQVIPYYRVYVKYAAMHGSYIINDPFIWSADSRFLATTVVNRLGFASPRTVVLPNKDIDTPVIPDSFRNLDYPMDWEAIIEYVGVPAIFKEIRSGGRRWAHRVSSVDELIQRYDESGTRTMILQEIIPQGEHIHCLVVGQEHVLPLHYSREDNCYLDEITLLGGPLARKITESAVAISKAYGYDINMIEYLVNGDHVYVINGTNPAPVMDRALMTEQQFNWAVEATVSLAIQKVNHPIPRRLTFNFDTPH
ncbi:MAG: ATP-grasp domain-containing protein [bacterium]